MMVEFRHLDVFRCVMQAGSFTKAARRLRTSQPTVSRTISELQAQIGFRLFVRKGASIAPTAEALDFFTVVDRSFVGIDSIMREAQSISGRRTDYLRVVSLPALAGSFLPQVIASFQKRHPTVRVSIDVQRSEAIAGWSAIESFDVGFSMLPIHRSGLSINKFHDSEGVCLLPENHPLASKECLSPDDLKGVDFISSGPFSFGSQQQQLDNILKNAGVHVNLKAETPITAIACELVARGVGVALVDRFISQTLGLQGLVAKPFSPSFIFHYGVFVPQTSVPHQLASEFINEAHSLKDRLVIK